MVEAKIGTNGFPTEKETKATGKQDKPQMVYDIESDSWTLKLNVKNKPILLSAISHRVSTIVKFLPAINDEPMIKHYEDEMKELNELHMLIAGYECYLYREHLESPKKKRRG